MEKSRYPPPNLYMHIFSEIFIAILECICYENKNRSQELNLDNKCFQQL